jgi:hypothetical protein
MPGRKKEGRTEGRLNRFVNKNTGHFINLNFCQAMYLTTMWRTKGAI